MFSNEGRSLDQETLEYAWLIEVQLGKLSGRLTTPHIENIVSSCEAFILTVLDEENSLRSPHSFLICHHGFNQFECASLRMEETSSLFEYSEDPKGGTVMSDSGKNPSLYNEHVPGERIKVTTEGSQSPKKSVTVCPTSEDIKYKLVRLSFDAIDFYLVENGTALSLWVRT